MHPTTSSKSKHFAGFTLVELIVTITILTILSSIGFVSMTGYFAGARDGARLSDIQNIYGQLSLTLGMDGTLPLPENYRTITMSGTTIAYQGYAGKTVLDSIKFNGGGKDPKDSTYYTYAIDIKKKQAQLMGYFEEYDTTKLSNLTKLLPEATAASLTNYSDRKIGLVGKKIGILVESGTLVPVQDSNTGTLDIANTSTVYVAYFDNSTIKNGTGTILKSAFTETSTIYTSTIGCTLSPSFSNLGTLTTGTPIAVNQAWTYSITPGNCTYVCTGGYTGSGCSIAPVYSTGTIYTVGQLFSYNGASITVTGPGYGSVPGTKTLHTPACDTDDIALFTGSLIQIWAACNAGANTAYISGAHGWSGTLIDASEPNRKLAYSGVINSAVNFLGNYYQWGRNDPVNLLTTSSSLYDGEYQTGGLSISGSGFLSSSVSMPFPWITVAKHDTSSGIIWTNSQTGKNGPCSPGYHIPTGETDATATYEWYTAYLIADSMSTLGSCSQIGTTPPYDRLRCALRIPLAGSRNWSGGYDSQGTVSNYWSSSPSAPGFTGADKVRFSNGGGNISDNSLRAYGFSVRCIRN